MIRVYLFFKPNLEMPFGMHNGLEIQRSPIGPIPVDEIYFVTRHPLSTMAPVKPFSALEVKFWINYFLIYIIFVLITLNIHSLLTKHLDVTQTVTAFIAPTSNAKIGGKFLCLFSFSFFTFSTLYGIDLWSALVGQTFEAKIDTWKDIDWLNSQFVLCTGKQQYRCALYRPLVRG